MVPREIFETIQSIEVVNGQVGDWPGLGQAQIDRQSSPSRLLQFESAPTHHASAGGAEVEAQRLAANVRLRRPTDVYVFPFIPVNPQNAISSAGGAITGSGGFGHRVEAPFHRPTKAAALEHRAKRRRRRPRLDARTTAAQRPWRQHFR